ncbi:MAG: integrase family protein [Herbinix sp.]|jgi:integrase|nr:integrase family protein [Herbinix sp.]
MKNPNGYGSVVYLGKRRRRPFAIRTSYSKDNPETGERQQKYKYIGYYEKSKDAIIALANYNSGLKIKEHISVSDQPTFDEIYNNWYEYKTSRNKKPSDGTLRNYRLAYGWSKLLHGKKFINIGVDDIQEVADQYNDKSESTVTMIKTVINQMYQYAIKRQIVEKNYTELVDWEYVESEEKAHTPFTDDEIEILWNNVEIEDVDLILMMIYTGFRASEFIKLENANVDIVNKYVIGGIKTDAGTNRMVALNEKILPLFKKRYGTSRYLIPNSKGTKYSYGVFYLDVFTRLMKQLNMNHTPHDTRHTFASLLDRVGANKICIKLLMGHAIPDLTEGVYTHKNLQDLLEAVNLIK